MKDGTFILSSVAFMVWLWAPLIHGEHTGYAQTPPGFWLCWFVIPPVLLGLGLVVFT